MPWRYFLLALLLPAITNGQDFTYETNTDGLTLTSYLGTNTSITLPDTIDGVTVTAVGDYAFQYGNFTSLTIPSGVSSIGTGSFANCTNLTEVHLTHGLTSIGVAAFDGCSKLLDINIPASVTNMEAAFSNALPDSQAGALLNIVVDADNASYVSTDGIVFSADQTQLVQYPCGRQGSYTVPSLVTKTGYASFSGCTLTNVIFPEGLTNIGSASFYKSPITQVLIPATVTTLELGAFQQSALSSVQFATNNQLTDMQGGIFNGCTNLTTIQLPVTVTNLGNLCFAYSGIQTITLPPNITSLNATFLGCQSLTNVQLPAQLWAVSYQLFNGCTALQQLVIPPNVTYCSPRAFTGCANLTQIMFTGNAPWVAYPLILPEECQATIYYLPTGNGWTNTFMGRQSLLWNPALTLDKNSQTIQILGTATIPYTLESTEDLAGIWHDIQIGTLTNGAATIHDQMQAKQAYYRVKF